MDPAVIKETGLDELGRALVKFGDVIATKHLNRATFKAARLIKDDAVARAPVRSGDLQEHIATFKRSAPKGVAHYSIGVRKIPKKIRRIARRLKAAGARFSIEHDPSYWWHVEFGTVHMAAEPFMRPAFEAEKNPAVEVFRTDLAENLASAVAEARGG